MHALSHCAKQTTAYTIIVAHAMRRKQVVLRVLPSVAMLIELSYCKQVFFSTCQSRCLPGMSCFPYNSYNRQAYMIESLRVFC